MKIILIIIFFIFSNNLCYSQVDFSEDWANTGWDFSSDSDSIVDVSTKIINETDLTHLLKYQYPRYNEESKIIPSYGILGSDFNKIEFLFSEVKQSDADLSKYTILGKSKLNNVIYDLKGNVTFKTAIAYIPKNSTKQTVVVLIGSYKLFENFNKYEASTHTGIVKLILFTKDIYAKKISFDMDMGYEDGAIKGFVGIQQSNYNNVSQSCLWGFTRFPYKYAKDFDIGDGEEVINIKYAKSWFNFTEQDWSNIINNETEYYLHQNNKNKGIHTSNKEYIELEETTWYKLDRIELKKTVINQLNINPNKIANELIVQEELLNNLNEIVIVIPEIENEIIDEELYYELTSHILIVNSITGKIKNHYSESSETNGWISDAIMIDQIVIDTNTYALTKTEKAFGVRIHFRGSSQPNPYYSTSLSLYIKEENKIKKILDNLEVYKSTGIVNVNVSTPCYAEFEETIKEPIIDNKNSPNGYYDLIIKETISNTIEEPDTNGDCDEKEIKRIESQQILKYNNTYE